MTVRKRKRKNKLRAQRTHGRGNQKNKGGAGTRGGRGKAGSHKHKYTKYYWQFGKEKKQVRGVEKGTALNLDQIEQFLPRWIKAGIAEQRDKEIMVDGKKAGFSKIVARGNLHSKIIFENISASKKAIEKIAQSGSVIKGQAQAKEGQGEEEEFEPAGEDAGEEQSIEEESEASGKRGEENESP